MYVHVSVCLWCVCVMCVCMCVFVVCVLYVHVCMYMCVFCVQDCGCLRAAVDLTGRLLTSGGQGEANMGQVTHHTPQTLQVNWKTHSIGLTVTQWQ